MVLPKLATVDDIVGGRGTVLCSSDCTLSEAAELLLLCGRTALLVLDRDGFIAGALTENDFLTAFTEGAAWGCPVNVWLQSGRARLSGQQLDQLTVEPSTTLGEAAAAMRAQASSGDIASRHLVVGDPAAGLLGIISAMDLARAVCAAGVDRDIAQRVRGKTVGQIMKTREVLPVCAKNATLSQAFQSMVDAHQNCVLVANAAEVLDVVTTRHVLQAFAFRIPGSASVWNDAERRAVAGADRGPQRSWAPRMVGADAGLAEAAAAMASKSVHHLLVVAPAQGSAAARGLGGAAGAGPRSAVVGVLSSTDLAQTIGSMEPHPRL
eukprot:TRINITY_DN15760_c0_g1_i1.p1 TRINITY_DN15760_c0_g1~~TRINITY_DN15760_c0_g1_i1.p1  ORF type:complete len:323 (-),score=64.91 TRINITY_DN15760_c0_g1_i1:115-1083(-)